jgi:hypothetical protein
MEPITLTFEHERDTKNTRRFQEVVEDGAAPVIGTLYVHNSVKTDDTLTVTVEGTTKAPARKRTSK